MATWGLCIPPWYTAAMPDDKRRNDGRWAKGQSGNAAGRRPRAHGDLKAELARLGDLNDPKLRKPRVVALAGTLWEMALHGGQDGTGNLEAARYIFDRLHGKPQVSVNLGGDAPPLAFFLVPPGQAPPDAEGHPPEGQGDIIDAAPGDYRPLPAETEPQTAQGVQTQVEAPPHE